MIWSVWNKDKGKFLLIEWHVSTFQQDIAKNGNIVLISTSIAEYHFFFKVTSSDDLICQ